MNDQQLSTEQRIADARIFIVDDELVHIKVLEWALRHGGFCNLRSIMESRKARDEFVRYRPDLVLLDLNMPGLDGFEVIEQLHESLSPHDFVPVLVLTGESSVETRVRALAAGASDFLSKPLDYTEVALRIKNLLRTRFLHQRLHQLEAELAEMKSTQKAP